MSKTFKKFFSIMFTAAFLMAAGVAGAQESFGDKVNDVFNDTGEYLDDSAITAKVKVKLAGELGMKSTNVSVETNDNVVVLTGHLESMDEVNRAISVVESTDGVHGYVNHITIVPDRD